MGPAAVRVTPTTLPEVLILEPTVHEDARGWFFETWQLNQYAALGLGEKFVQDNVSHSKRGVLRGLHFQEPNSQGKLASALTGKVYDVAVDVRRGSPTFGKWVGVELSAENHRQLWVPRGFAHGFCVLSESADFLYKCTDYYDPQSERGIRWDDPEIGIDWPIRAPVLSPKDRDAPKLKDSKALPTWPGKI